MTLASLKRDLRAAADPKKAAFFPRFFKTGPGQYGEGDRFLGVTVPAMRVIAKRHSELPLRDIEALLRSPWHEERLVALLILVARFRAGNGTERETIAAFYLAHADRVNNWDLVDASAYHIVGEHLVETRAGTAPLKCLARSENLWEQRIAMVATLAFLRAGDLRPTAEIAALFLDHGHDLMHKATGWMLREMGKRDPAALREFLEEYAKRMPRTMLRYAIEKFPEPERKRWLQRKTTLPRR